MAKQEFTQIELMEALGGQDMEARKAALRQLFGDSALRQLAITHVCTHGGNRQDGEDVFQEAIIAFDRKLRQGAFRGESNLETFFMGIVRWHWFNERQRAGAAATVYNGPPPEPPPGGNPELEYLLRERRELLEKLQEQLSDKCRSILKMYQLDYSMDDIAQALGFANSGVAKKEAFLCRKRFQAILKKYPELWQDIINKK